MRFREIAPVAGRPNPSRSSSATIFPLPSKGCSCPLGHRIPLRRPGPNLIRDGETSRKAFVHSDWWEFHRPGATGPIFLIEGTTSKIRKEAFPDIQKKAGLDEKGVAWHSLGHTYSYRLLTDGGSLEMLQNYLSHSSITITEDYYGSL